MSRNFEDLLNLYLQTALLAANAARKITRKWFRSELAISSKQDKSPVTIADQETEETIKQIIFDTHPNHGFFGEESGNQLGNEQWQWVIDPIDGTKCFATGMPTFGTLICVMFEGKPVIGIIDHSMLDERWIGVQGQPTTHNGSPCKTRQTKALIEASVYTTTADMFNDVTGKQADSLSQSCQFRVFGGDCYGYGLLASGYNDLVCEADLKPYDFFALLPVVQGAGGVITDWQGNTLNLQSNGEVIAAANADLHQLAIDKLNR